MYEEYAMQPSIRIENGLVYIKDPDGHETCLNKESLHARYAAIQRNRHEYATQEAYDKQIRICLRAVIGLCMAGILAQIEIQEAQIEIQESESKSKT